MLISVVMAPVDEVSVTSEPDPVVFTNENVYDVIGHTASFEVETY